MEENTNSPYTAPQANMNMAGQSEFGPITPLLQSGGWLKFFGVMAIIMGALQVLTIWGIVLAWLPIWIGVLLFQAGSRLNSMNTEDMVYEGADKLRLVIKIWGIYMIVTIGLMVVGLIFWASFLGAMLAGAGSGM